METIVIAGGTGMIGSALAEYWSKIGHEVRILSRKPSEGRLYRFQWNPEEKTIDDNALINCTILINLSGEGIGEKRWTAKRKQELYDSRIKTTEFLRSLTPKMPHLKQYISASGINCYGFDTGKILHTETDPFGNDDTSQLVRSWEDTAHLFDDFCLVSCIRTSIVLSEKGGALPKLAQPIKWRIGAPLGNGAQAIPWIHLDDIVRVYDHVMTHQLTGSFNANAGNTTNKLLTQVLADKLYRKLWMPNVPAFVLYLVFGQMADLLLKGAKTDNKKLKETGFEFLFEKLEYAMDAINYKL